MTNDEMQAGRWQGNVDARVQSLERRAENHAALVTDLSTRLTKIESRQSVMWSGLAASIAIAGGAVFNLWTSGSI